MINIICAILYLLPGLMLFKAAVRELKGDYSKLTYFFWGAIVTFFWPWFIILSMFKED